MIQSEAERRPLLLCRGENGTETAVYGDCLPRSEGERLEREEELAALCARLCLRSGPEQETE